MTTSPKAPLWNEDAEQAVLSAMFADERAITTVAAALTRDSFYRAAHGHLFAAITAVHGSGATVDPITVANALTAAGALEAAGGKAYIGELLDVVPTALNVAHHAGIVRDLAQRRALIAELESSAALLRDVGMGTVKDVARTMSGSLLSFTVDDSDDVGYLPLKKTIYATLEQVEATANGSARGLLTGYRKIDAETGGFLPGELVILGGAEKMGKSVTALNICLRIASRPKAQGGGACAYVSAEMTRSALTKRALAWQGKVDARKLRTGSLVDHDWPRLAHAAGVLANLPLWIDDEAEPSLADIVARTTALKAQHPELALVVVDFLQLVHQREKGVAESVELKRVAYGLKRLAKKLGIVVVAPCQVNTKDIEDLKDPRPRLKDLQGSSGMRAAADFVVLLYRPAVYDALGANPFEIELNFAAAREAPPFLARLRWDGQTQRIDDFDDVPHTQHTQPARIA